MPPTRIIGFNPQLKMNDGLLVQSYMAVYDTDFSDATRIVGKSVKELLALLHENGKADLPNIGELRYNIHDSYDFTPYDDKLTTPYLYGLGSFEMQELEVLHERCRNRDKTIPFAPVVREEKKRKYGIEINTSYLANAVAMIAVAALFFFLPAPVENTEVMEANYARLLPGDLFGQIEKQSLAITPIVIHQQETGKKAKTTRSAGKKPVAPVAVKEVKVRQQAATIAAQPKATPTVPTPAISSRKDTYHIIIASVGSEKDADTIAQQLVAKGYAGAKAIIGDGKMRVSIQSCATEKEAYRALNLIRQNEAYKSAWVLKR